MSPFFNFYHIPQINCKFTRLAISPLCSITLLMKIMLTIVEKSFFTLTNVGASLYMLEQRSLFFKEMFFLVSQVLHFFGVQFQIQTCLGTAQAVWVPKHLRPQEYCFSICIQLKLRRRFQISSLRYVLEAYDTYNNSSV